MAVPRNKPLLCWICYSPSFPGGSDGKASAYNAGAEKAMAIHFSTLARQIPWVEEPGRLQSMWLLRVGHNWVTSLSLFTFMHWRRKWQLTPVFLPGKSHGWRNLVSYSPWGRKESDTTERLHSLHAIVQGQPDKVIPPYLIKSATLPAHMFSQQAETIALTQDLTLAKDQKINIYPDSNMSITHYISSLRRAHLFSMLLLFLNSSMCLSSENKLL